MTNAPQEPPQPDDAPPNQSPWGRLVLVAVLLVGTYALASSMGWLDQLNTQWVQDTVAKAGWWGAPAFLGIFAAGYLAHIPALVFIAAGLFAFGQVKGGVLALLGSMLALTCSFWFVRLVGGSPLAKVKNPRMRRMLDKLDDAPMRTTALLRLFFFLAPPVTYTLALSSIRFRDFFLGSMAGLVLPMTIIVLFYDVIFG